MKPWWKTMSIAAAIVLPACGDVLLEAGETYTFRFMTLEAPPWPSPGLPAYDDYSFALNLSAYLYNNPPDDIRIRLYEDPDGAVPSHDIFGENVPNLSVMPSRIAITEVPGTLWFDHTGRIEVEVITGSINITHMNIDLGPGQLLNSAYIEAVPEPGSLALTLIGAGGLIHYRRARRGRDEIRIKATPSIPWNEPADQF